VQCLKPTDSLDALVAASGSAHEVNKQRNKDEKAAAAEAEAKQ